MRQMTSEQIQKYKENPTVIIKTQDGKTFRCLECKSNCFHHPGTDLDKFECNSCHERYVIQEDYATDDTLKTVSKNDFIKKLESIINEVKNTNIGSLHYNINEIDYYINSQTESDNCGNFTRI
jgi:hypothetical protein